MSDSFFHKDATLVAPELIGAVIFFWGIGGVIIEVEAYRQDDPASHSFGGKTQRNSQMFGLPGSVYIYRSYGIHWCLNIVCETGSAVLIRALEPTRGIDQMCVQRNTDNLLALCSGPGKICQALNLDGKINGYHLMDPPFEFQWPRKISPLVRGHRVGISKAKSKLWRFGMANSKYWSRPF